MTDNLNIIINGLTENDWEHTIENSIHIFRKHKIKFEIFWHLGQKEIWEIHIYEGEFEKPTIVTIEDESLGYPLTLDQGIYIE